jgi:hypothetical protein
MAGAGPFPTPAARLSALEPFSLAEADRAAVLEHFAQLVRALAELDAFVGQAAEPATGFDPLLGDEA